MTVIITTAAATHTRMNRASARTSGDRATATSTASSMGANSSPAAYRLQNAASTASVCRLRRTTERFQRSARVRGSVRSRGGTTLNGALFVAGPGSDAVSRMSAAAADLVHREPEHDEGERYAEQPR